MRDFSLPKGRRALRYMLGGNLNALKGRAKCGMGIMYLIFIAIELALDYISVNYVPGRRIRIHVSGSFSLYYPSTLEEQLSFSLLSPFRCG